MDSAAPQLRGSSTPDPKTAQREYFAAGLSAVQSSLDHGPMSCYMLCRDSHPPGGRLSEQASTAGLNDASPRAKITN
jgi:hypothetical protein